MGIPTLTHSDARRFRTNGEDPEKIRGVAYMEVMSRARARGGRMWIHDERVGRYFFLATHRRGDVRNQLSRYPNASYRLFGGKIKNEPSVNAPQSSPLPPFSAGPRISKT